MTEENEEYSPMADVSVCSHGKETGVNWIPMGSKMTFPGCGRDHHITPDKYSVHQGWVEEEEQLKVMQARAAKARAARFGEDAS